MKVNILGTTYEIQRKTEQEEPRLKDADGFTDWTGHKIVVMGIESAEGNLEDMDRYFKKVIRHEIVHAFLIESGLHECSGPTEAWAANETMVDWFARQGPKIYKVWQEADAL